jgi:multicomponent Na+:H+ antiporter subunit E
MMSKFQEIGWSTVTSRGLVFSIVWWMLTDGNVQSWWIGVPAVSFAMIASIALLPPVPLVWRGLLKFTPFFLWRSLQGGADVAWRAFHPGMPIAPAVIDYPLRLPPGLPQVFLANIVSLLPGTLSATLDGQALKVHVLDSRGDFMTELKALEQRVARMCGVLLATSHGGE